jgi:hypothetical protein
MKIDVIIKFGGSAVTVKDQLETLKEEELLQACALVNISTTTAPTFLLIFDYHEMNFKPVRYFGSPLIWDCSQE